jgi:uncharacterized OsmC-like protein
VRDTQTHRSGVLEPHRWTARALPAGPGAITVYARNHRFTAGSQASFAPTDLHPGAVEYLLGALAADILAAFLRQASRRGLPIAAAEASVSGSLNNPLLVVGVIGETGHPGFEEIAATLYVTTEAEESLVRASWTAALESCPVVHTLQRAVPLTLNLQVVF